MQVFEFGVKQGLDLLGFTVTKVGDKGFRPLVVIPAKAGIQVRR
jgi:hypothetical protein